MSDDDVQRQMRVHIAAFGAILLLSLVAASTVLADAPRIGAVMGIAATQIFLVLVFMMHIRRDGPWVRVLLACCALFVAAMAGLFLLGQHDPIEGTERVTVETQQVQAEIAVDTDEQQEHD